MMCEFCLCISLCFTCGFISYLIFRMFRTNVNDGQIEIWASEWPWFMYDNADPLDPEEEDKGLCRGYILVRVSPVASEKLVLMWLHYRLFVTFSLGHHQLLQARVPAQNHPRPRYMDSHRLRG